MKIIIYFIILIVGIIPVISAQSFNKSIKSIPKSEITVKTTLKNNKKDILPPPSSEKFKVHIENLQENTNILVFMKEYIDGKWKQTQFDYQGMGTCNKNGKYFFEINLYFADSAFLKTYILYPEKTFFNQRIAKKDYHIKFVPYKNNPSDKEEIPLLFIYEDNSTQYNEKIISKFIQKDSLNIDFDKNNKPYSQINKYTIISYKKEKNEK